MIKFKEKIAILKNTANAKGTLVQSSYIQIEYVGRNYVYMIADDTNTKSTVLFECDCPKPFDSFYISVENLNAIEKNEGFLSAEQDTFKAGKFTFKAIGQGVDPLLSHVTSKSITSLLRINSEILHSFVPYTSKDLTRHVLMGVFMDTTRGCIIALDGHYARRRKVKFENTFDIVIPSTGIKVIPKKDQVQISYCEINNVLVVMGSEYTIKFKAINDQYPNYPQVFPDISSSFSSLTVNLSDLKEVVPESNKTTRQIAFDKGAGKILFCKDSGQLIEYSSDYVIEGEQDQVSYNGELLLKVLQDSGDNTIYFNTPLSAGRIKENKDGEDFLLMPLRRTTAPTLKQGNE